MGKKIILVIIGILIFSQLILFPIITQASSSEVIANETSNLGIFSAVTQSAASAADAQRAISVPTFDVVQYSQLRAVEQAKETKTTKSNILNSLFKILLESLRKRLLDMLVDQIVKWIQGGGEPKFVTDWQSFLNNAGQAAIGDVILQTDAAFLCSPFKLSVRLSLLPVQKFSQRVQCTLNDVVKNIDDFYNNFENGGWIAYNASLSPQNNYFGVMMLTYDEMLNKQAEARNAAKNEAQASGGFLSMSRCIEYDEAKISECRGAWSDNSDLFQKCVEQNACSKKEIVTPGKVVGEMASKAVGSDLDYILSATELEQYVTAIVNAAINRVITEGIGYIKGSSQQDTSAYTQPYTDAVTGIQQQEKDSIIAEYKKVLDDRNAILASKNQSLSNVQQLVVVLQSIQSNNCQPQVSATDISNAQSEVSRLTTDITNLQKVISDITALKSQAESISPDYRLREMDILTTQYNEFTTNYSSVIGEVYSGSAKNDAAKEATTKQSELSNAQSRLSVCANTNILQP